jgi:hypothetical protein
MPCLRWTINERIKLPRSLNLNGNLNYELENKKERENIKEKRRKACAGLIPEPANLAPPPRGPNSPHRCQQVGPGRQPKHTRASSVAYHWLAGPCCQSLTPRGLYQRAPPIPAPSPWARPWP